MRRGSCGRYFDAWQRCVKQRKGQQRPQRASAAAAGSSSPAPSAADDRSSDEASLCLDAFRPLHDCIQRLDRGEAGDATEEEEGEEVR